MHELGITRNIVSMALEHSHGMKVQRVILEIGQLSAIMPESIAFCFDSCCQGTDLEGATLEIIEIAGLGACRDCGNTLELDYPFGICDRCGSCNITVLQGQELNLKSLEIESICA
jgi:hydrogenase nickel incorporation protein HypA/HybF